MSDLPPDIKAIAETDEFARVQQAIEDAIRYARGEGAPHLVSLDDHHRNIAELGARRAIVRLFMLGKFTINGALE